MNKIEKKAMHFLTALLDVYRDEEKRELAVLSKLDLTEDITEDFTAMLLAMKVLFERFAGDDERDLIDFTHVLNKLAIQYVMENQEVNHNETP